MRRRCCTWLLLAVGAGLTASVLRADDDSLVPPWGRDLEAAHPVIEEPPEHGEFVYRIWARGEYLLWWIRDDRTPALLTQGLASAARAGALGQPMTRGIYGGQVDFEERSGGRFTLGFALMRPARFFEPGPNEGGCAVEFDYLYLSGRDVGVHRSSPGSPVLARPFFDVVNGREDASLVSYPGLLQGGIEINSASHLQGAEANLHKTLWHDATLRVDGLAGFRWLNLNEDLSILEQSAVVDPSSPLAGTRFRIGDEFETDNHFCGGQVGLAWELHWKRFRLKFLQKLALGTVHETVDIRGRTVIDDGTPTTSTAGLLALASNSGERQRNRFAVVPEIGASLGLALTERLSFFAGYSLIYWSEVARPGEQIDRALNPNLIPTSATFGGPATPSRPAFRFESSDWLAHGVNLGIEWRY